MLSGGVRWATVVIVGLLAPGGGWLATGAWRRALLSLAGALLLIAALRWAITSPSLAAAVLGGLVVLHGLSLAGGVWRHASDPAALVSFGRGLRAVFLVVGFWVALGVFAVHHTALLGVQLYQVRGASMAPALMAGDWLLASTRAHPETLQPGDLVLVNDPLRPSRRVVKRLERIEPGPPHRWHLHGDNPGHSLDSRHYGAVDPALYQAHPVWHWRASQGVTGMQWLR